MPKRGETDTLGLGISLAVAGRPERQAVSGEKKAGCCRQEESGLLEVAIALRTGMLDECHGGGGENHRDESEADEKVDHGSPFMRIAPAMVPQSERATQDCLKGNRVWDKVK